MFKKYVNKIGILFKKKPLYTLAGFCMIGFFCCFGWQLDLFYRAERIRQEWEKRGIAVLLPFPHSKKEISYWENYEVPIPSANFTMGCTSKQLGCDVEDQRIHEVELTHSFYMMKSEVTQLIWKEVMGSNPSYYSACGDNCPVDSVSWYDVIEFSNRFNEMWGLEHCYEINNNDVIWSKGYDCKGWRLPTEAEWDYASWGGEDFQFPGSDQLDEVGWYADNSGGVPHPVCEKRENGYALCDMSGNVDEWVWDRYDKYPHKKQIDPKGPETGSDRSVRGGSWYCDALSARNFDRGGDIPSIKVEFLGVRLARSIQ